MTRHISLFTLISAALLSGVAPAWAENVDISSMEKVEVSDWASLKAAVENSANAGKAIVLTQDITADKDNPITSVGGEGIIIDGGTHTITGQEGTSADGQFIYFTSSDTTDLTIQNVNLKGFGNVQSSNTAHTGAIFNKGSINNITANFSNNYSHRNGGAIYIEDSVNNIEGTFSQNYSLSFGGAIYNEGSINDISGEFNNNYSISAQAWGGAIYNGGFNSSINSITANFIKNHAISDTYDAAGGAIYNHGTIGDITGNFTGNYAQSTSGYTTGGAIYNSDTIKNITGTFTGNYAKSDSSYALGGAIYNDGTISGITGIFSGNYAKSDSSDASGGAIYNYGTMTLVNSSFYNNYVQTGATKDSENGQQTQGGAIYSSSNLTIKADNGQSIFSGNKVKWADGEDSSAITIIGYNTTANLKLDSQNTGLIQFDDKIATSAPLKEALANAEAYGATISDDGNGGYILTYEDGTNKHITKTDDGFLAPAYVQNNIPQNILDQMLSTVPSEFVQKNGDNYIISGVMDGDFIYSEVVKQDNGTYTVINYDVLSGYGANITITGDENSRVEFNNAIEDFGTIDISGTNVDVNDGVGTIYRTITHDNGVLNINKGAQAEDSIVNNLGTLNVADTAKIYRTEVNDGGTLHVAAGGYAQDTTVNGGGKVTAENTATLHNMLVNDDAVLDIDSGAFLTGNIIIHAGALMGGTYDYSKIFKDEVTDAGSLTLVGGLNDILTEDSLINSTDAKKLNLTAGNYAIGDGAQAVHGWDLLTFKDTANIKLEGDISLTGPNKKVIIENGSTLDLAGHSPSNYTITGSVNNDGMMTFSHVDDEADDITTIYGNYKAYNNAQMTIDVNPTTNTSDLLRIDGDVEGTTNVILNVLQNDVKPTQLIQFVDAQNDDLSTSAYFNVYRVDGSAYKWNSLYKDHGWYVGTDDLIPDGSESGYGTDNTTNLEDDVDLDADAVLPPNFPAAPTTPNINGNGSSPSVVGEAIAYMGLPSAGIEQTRDMTRNITDKVAATKVYSKQCHGFYDCDYDGAPLRNLWAMPVYSYSDVKAPYSFEAEISGFEAGGDIQSDVYNRLGVFASYRQGSYDFDGDGDDYYSKTGADMDIDSYILGLYHRYDEGKLWTMGQIFLGYQDVSISSDDGVSSSTDGIEFGASVEAGLVFNPMTNLTIEPIVRLAYTQINYDDASDAYGKTANYDDVRNIEIEAGVKVEKTYLRKDGYAKLYVKPSIVQNIGSGDVQVTSLRKVDGLDNATLGRLEVGGSMSFSEQWSGYANAAYTFGADYTNLGLNAGLNYSF